MSLGGFLPNVSAASPRGQAPRHDSWEWVSYRGADESERRPRLPAPHPCTLALLAPLAPLSAARSETLPAVTRPTFLVGSELRAAGTAFFIPVKDEVGVAAIATAHAVSLDDLAKTKEVEFRLGSTQQPVTVSSRFLVSPGRPYFAAGASVSDDFLVFALDAAPHGVRVLEPDPRGVTVGERVQLLGLPAQVPQGETPRDEEAQFGTVTAVVADRIDVDLDTKADSAGLGRRAGAQLRQTPRDRFARSREPQGATLRLKVSPIGAVTTALETPLDGGLGRAFSGFRAEDTGLPPRVEPPQTASNTARALSPDARPAAPEVEGPLPGAGAPNSASPLPASNSAAPSRSAPPKPLAPPTFPVVRCSESPRAAPRTCSSWWTNPPKERFSASKRARSWRAARSPCAARCATSMWRS